MANPKLYSFFGNPDPNAAPLNLTELIGVLNQLVITDFVPGETFTAYFIGPNQPGVQDQDKAWIQTQNGKPIATKIFYNGNWRRIYNGMLGEIRIFSGDPTVTTDWDTDGRGVVGGTYDGWQICNGNNGSQDLTDKFILAAHMNSGDGHSGYSGGWQSWINGTSAQQTGGHDTITTGPTTTYRPSTAAVKVDRYDASGETNNVSGNLYGINSVQHIDLVPADAGNLSPTPISIEPPFIAMGLMQFIGYA